MKKFLLLLATGLSFSSFCQRTVYACTTSGIYKVKISTCTATLLTNMSALMDIAVTPDGRLWALTSTGAYQSIISEVDTVSGAGGNSFFFSNLFQPNSLVALNNTELLVNSGADLVKVNNVSGADTLIGNTGYSFSGDMSWYDNDLYISTSGGILVKLRLNAANDSIQTITPINFAPAYSSSNWGLGAYTSSVSNSPNYLIGSHSKNIVKICPLDATYQTLCPNIVSDLIYGIAVRRLPVQNPEPTQCSNTTVGVVDFDVLKDGVIISPNPCYQESEITTQVDLKDACVTILDYSGKVLREINHLEGHTFKFQRSDMSAGAYFLQIKEDAQVMFTGKLIVADR